MCALLGLAIWIGTDFLAEGLGKTFGMGFCCGVIVAFALMFFGGLWSESARRRADRRQAAAGRLSPLPRAQEPVADFPARDRLSP